MTRFYDEAKQHQIKWRSTQLAHLPELGIHAGRRYPHLLPSDHWLQGLFPPIRDRLKEYLAAYWIQPHSHKHNLLSSWILCANMYFPFRGNPAGLDLLTGFLASKLGTRGRNVENIELEYSLDPPLDASTLLGESGGRRGASQTSPDVAFELSKGAEKALVLTECKYIEASFSGCSGYSKSDQKLRGRPANPDRERCHQSANVIGDPEHFCHLTVWDRRYWEYLAPIADRGAFRNLEYCPARSSGYQLLREYTYAQALFESGRYEKVIYAIAWDQRNEALTRSMRRVGIVDIESGWQSLFPRGVSIKTWSHADWVDHVESHGGAQWSAWVEYVRARYGWPRTS